MVVPARDAPEPERDELEQPMRLAPARAAMAPAAASLDSFIASSWGWVSGWWRSWPCQVQCVGECVVRGYRPPPRDTLVQVVPDAWAVRGSQVAGGPVERGVEQLRVGAAVGSVALHDQEVGQGQRELAGGGRGERAAAYVRCHREEVGVGQGGDLLGLGKPADLRDVEVEYRRRGGPGQRGELPLGGEPLPRRHGNGGRSRYPRHLAGAFWRHGLFEPQRPVRLELAGEANGTRGGELPVRPDHDVRPAADGAADRGHDRLGPVERVERGRDRHVLARLVAKAGQQRQGVDLEAGEALVGKLSRPLADGRLIGPEVAAVRPPGRG